MSQIPVDPKLKHIIDEAHAVELRQQQADPVLTLLSKILVTLDVSLQLQGRIALGWDPAAAARDIGINVPEHDGSGLREAPGQPAEAAE